jgi:hypothetical protein
MKLKVHVFVLLVLISFGSLRTVFADPSPCESYGKADAVFLGPLVAVESGDGLIIKTKTSSNRSRSSKPKRASPTVAENHSINVLKRAPERDLPKILNGIPPDQLGQILDILQDLKNKSGIRN